MNTTEQLQFSIVKRIYARDPQRIRNLYNQSKLMVHPEVIEWLLEQEKRSSHFM